MSSLAVFLSLPADYDGPPLPIGWRSLSVPSSAHSVKPFLEHLRSSLGVHVAYGFKLSVRAARGGPGQPSPVGAADAKPITSLAEFQSLFEQLEWAEDAEALTLVVELKKKEGATPAAAASPVAAAPRFTAPSKATAKPVDLTPAAPSAISAAAPAPVSSQQPQSVSMSERDPNYKSPFTQGSSASTSAGSSAAAPSSTWARQQNEAALSPTAGGVGAAGVAARLAMFGGASIAAGNRVYNNNAAASASNGSSVPVTQPPPPAAKAFTPPTASPPPAAAPASAAATLPPPPPPSVAAAPVPPSASPAALVESLRAITFAAPAPAPAPAPSAAAAPSFVPAFAPPASAPVFGGFGGGDPDLDLPPPPSGFSDPFATASAPAPAPMAAAPAAAAPASSVFGGASTPALPSPPTSAPPAAAAAALAQSTFLTGLKSNQATLAFQYAHDSFREMIALCRAQEALFRDEVSSGLLREGSGEKERAANGLLLYLNHSFQAHTALGEYSVASGVAKRFEEAFATLPAHLSAIKENKEMRIQLRYNAGLALEKAGQPAEALGQLEAAAALVDEGAGALPGRHVYVPLRSEVCSALGNLLVSQRELDRASAWHARAVENEELAEGPGPRKWGVYHAAASCAAMRGDFLRAVEWDTRAIDMMQQQTNPRVHFNRGLCLQKLNQWGESVADFTRVVEIDPANVKGFVLRAKAMLRQERWADVVADCDAALKLAPQDAQSREFKEFALQRLG